MTEAKFTLRWYNKLLFKIPIMFLLLFGGLVITVWLVMNTVSKKKLQEQSYRLISQSGNTMVTELVSRTVLAESIAKALANLGEKLPADVDVCKELLPNIIDYEGAKSLIAGGGIWPQPYSFLPNVERRSFFWGRNEQGVLEYYDSYNDPNGTGYHNEEWYVPAKQLGNDQSFWSKSYMDPYSYQPMVTCTVPMYRDGRLYGVSTVDLKLEGLKAFFEKASSKLGGYSFAVDRNGKFLSFPEESMTKIYPLDSKGNRTEEFITVAELALKNKLFKPIADAVEQVNTDIIEKSQIIEGYDRNTAEIIDADSYQIDSQEAELIAAVLLDPLKDIDTHTLELKRFNISDDVLLNKSCIVSVFHVPGTYWKVVTVMPVSQAFAASASIYNTILWMIIGIVTIFTLVSFILMKLSLIAPLTSMERQLQRAAESGIEAIGNIELGGKNELNALAYWFNQYQKELSTAMDKLQNSHHNMEEQVKTRTAELETNNKQLVKEISERKLMEIKLHENEEKYHLIYDKANDGIMLLKDGIFVDCNSKTAELFGCTKEQFIGHSPHKFSPLLQPDGSTSIASSREKIKAAAEGEPQRFEWVHCRLDGTCFDAEVALNSFTLKGKTHIQAVVRDITERKEAEKQIHTSQQMLQTILDTMPVGMVIVGADKKIRQINKFALNMAGYKRKEDLVGHTCNKTLCPAQKNKCPVFDLHSKLDMSEKILITSDGRKVPIIKSAVLVNFGQEEVLLETFVDISERKKAEKTIKLANENLVLTVDKLTAANRDLSDFTHITAHDLKAPLRAIGSLAGILRQEYRDRLDTNGRKYLDTIKNRTERMNKLINSVLRYSEVGQITEKKPVDTNEVLNDVFDKVDIPGNIEVVVENKLPVINCDSQQIFHVFRNLISNAVKFMNKPNGFVRVDCVVENGSYKFSVADSGCGIEKKYFDKIFKIFQTLVRRDEIESIGVGLAVVRKIVEAYNGKVWVESEPYIGSTFYFTLPLKEVEVKNEKLQADFVS